MSEFLNRVSAQRMVLGACNGYGPVGEELMGLSSAAIERWMIANQLSSTDPLVVLIKRASERLFCLANKSQEQLTDEYHWASQEIVLIASEIESISAGRR